MSRPVRRPRPRFTQTRPAPPVFWPTFLLASATLGFLGGAFWLPLAAGFAAALLILRDPSLW